MAAVTHDAAGVDSPVRSAAWTGLLVALVSAAAFGLSGAVAKPLLAAGWSAGAVVVARVGLELQADVVVWLEQEDYFTDRSGVCAGVWT